MFGFKRKKVYTKNQYSVESLYEAVKNHKFTAGTPKLFSIAYASIITFPPLDRNNQVWIEDDKWVKWYKRDQCKKWLIHLREPLGGGELLKNMALDEVTGGLSGLSAYFGKKVREAERLVEITAQELDSLGL